MSWARHILAVASLGAALLASSCNSPTLPQPPPAEGNIQATLEADGKSVRIVGMRAVEPYALVTCFNNRDGQGVVGAATGQGSFDLMLGALPGDVVEVWQRVGNDPPSVVVNVK